MEPPCCNEEECPMLKGESPKTKGKKIQKRGNKKKGGMKGRNNYFMKSISEEMKIFARKCWNVIKTKEEKIEREINNLCRIEIAIMFADYASACVYPTSKYLCQMQNRKRNTL